MAKYDIDTFSFSRRAFKRQKGTRKCYAATSPDGNQDGPYAGLMRLHVLHHALTEAVYGFVMIMELRLHG